MSKVNVREYLKKPYARRLTPDEAGGYVATIQEFQGCIAEGDSAQDALDNLEQAAASWIEAADDLGQEIPEPVALHGYSGKIALRVPRGLHKQAVEMASSEGTSLNQLLVTAIANYLGGRKVLKEMSDRLFREMGAGTPPIFGSGVMPRTENLHNFSMVVSMFVKSPNQPPVSYANIGCGKLSERPLQ